MKIFIAFLSIVLWSHGGHSMPQYNQQPQQQLPTRRPNHGGNHNLPDGCRIVYQTVQTIVEVEREETVCKPYTDRVCQTRYRDACSPYYDDECKTEYREVCETKYNRKCQQLYKNVPEEYEEEECRNEYKRVCDSRWFETGRDKVWKEDPATCKELPETNCKNVRKTRVTKQPYTDCKNEPYRDCNTVPDQKCRKVKKQRCQKQAYQDCNNVTKQKCEKQHIKSPQSQASSKPVRICDGGSGGGSSGYPRRKLDRDVEIIEDPRTAGKGLNAKPRDNPENDDDVVVFSN